MEVLQQNEKVQETISDSTINSDSNAGNKKSIWKKIRPYRIIRDIILVQIFDGLGGFILGYTCSVNHFDYSKFTNTNGVEFAMMPVALSIVAALNTANRWRHLAIVTIATFLLSIPFEVFNVTKLIAFLMFFIVGGLLSYVYPIFRNKE